jgi:DNA-directed RNA polymerase specialized sigma24 family protein
MATAVNPEDERVQTSWTLVGRIKNVQDQESWTRFYDLYKGLVLGVSMKAGLTKEEAEDVLQATMASVSKNIGQFEANPGPGSFGAWLLQLGGSGQGNAPTATGVTPTVERVPDTRAVDLEALCDAEWKQRLMQQALRELQLQVKAEHYQIFHLVELEQKPVAEVAAALGKSRAQVYVVRHRVALALKRILKRLKKQFG